MVWCSTCGINLEDKTIFCWKCGTRKKEVMPEGNLHDGLQDVNSTEQGYHNGHKDGTNKEKDMKRKLCGKLSNHDGGHEDIISKEQGNHDNLHENGNSKEQGRRRLAACSTIVDDPFTDSEPFSEYSYPSSEMDPDFVPGSESDESEEMKQHYGSFITTKASHNTDDQPFEMPYAEVSKDKYISAEPLEVKPSNHKDYAQTHLTTGASPLPNHTVIPTNNNIARVYDKKHNCVFCNIPQSKLPRHLTTKHASEKEVNLYINEKDPHLKSNMLKKLRNLGNHQHNVKVIREREGSLMVKYRPAVATETAEYLPCEYCYGYYKSFELWKHTKRCSLAPESSCKRSRRVVASSRLLLPLSADTSDDLRELLSALSTDNISFAVKSDRIILKLGEKMFKTHGHNKEKYSMLRTTLREVGRLVLQLRASCENPNAALSTFIDPIYFKAVVEATKIISGFSRRDHTFTTPSLALKIGHSLKKCCKILEGEAIETGHEDQMKKAIGFFKLIEMNWTDEVSTHALRTLGERKRNKVKLLPLTKDVKLLNDHLDAKGKDAKGALEMCTSNISAWSDLSKVTLTQILIFNRRRQGEVSKMKLADLKESHSAGEEDIHESLSSFEKKLCKIFRRIEIVGKRGRTVPVILTNETKKWLDLLVNTRAAVGVAEGNQFIFARPHYDSQDHIRGSDCLREFSEECGAEHPHLLRSTKLRFQIATLSQVLNLKEHELDLLADFLGHDIRVHREFYRLPEHTLQIAKVSKILLAMESGQISKQAGKSLDEIALDADEEIDVDIYDSDVVESDEDEDGPMSNGNEQNNPGLA